METMIAPAEAWNWKTPNHVLFERVTCFLGYVNCLILIDSIVGEKERKNFISFTKNHFLAYKWF